MGCMLLPPTGRDSSVDPVDTCQVVLGKLGSMSLGQPSPCTQDGSSSLQLSLLLPGILPVPKSTLKSAVGDPGFHFSPTAVSELVPCTAVPAGLAEDGQSAGVWVWECVPPL